MARDDRPFVEFLDGTGDDPAEATPDGPAGPAADDRHEGLARPGPGPDGHGPTDGTTPQRDVGTGPRRRRWWVLAAAGLLAAAVLAAVVVAIVSNPSAPKRPATTRRTTVAVGDRSVVLEVPARHPPSHDQLASLAAACPRDDTCLVDTAVDAALGRALRRVYPGAVGLGATSLLELDDRSAPRLLFRFVHFEEGDAKVTVVVTQRPEPPYGYSLTQTAGGIVAFESTRPHGLSIVAQLTGVSTTGADQHTLLRVVSIPELTATGSATTG